MGRRAAIVAAGLVWILLIAPAAISSAAAQPAGSAAAARRLTTVEALKQFPGFYHLQNVVLRGEFVEDGKTISLRADDGSIVIERADGTRPPSRFAKLVGSAGPGPTTDELMELLRGEPE